MKARGSGNRAAGDTVERVLWGELDERGVARLVLNRPTAGNAIDDEMVRELTLALEEMAVNPAVKVVVLAAQGSSFCAGADLKWMLRLGEAPFATNMQDARDFGRMLRLLEIMPKPTIAAVQGSAIGGGLALVACCDIAVAAEEARFAMPEVRLAMQPSVLSVHVLAAMGARQARRYFLTGETFDAATAHRLNLVHEVVAMDDLAGTVDRFAATLAALDGEAVADLKALIAACDGEAYSPALIEAGAERVARARASADTQGKLRALLDELRRKRAED